MYVGNFTKHKEMAKELRRKGHTYSEISKIIKLKIPKSTFSLWCKDVVLPSSYTQKLKELNHQALTKGQKMACLSNKRKQEQILKNLETQNKGILKYLKNKYILKIILSMLYLGEGSKWKSHRGLVLGSSDPLIIQIYLRLLKLCYNLHPKDLHCRVSLRADQNLLALEKFWSKVTSIPLKNFYKTKADPRTIGKPTLKSEYKGVCVILGGGTRIQLELEIISKILHMGM